MRKVIHFFDTWIIRKTPTSFIASITLSYGVSNMNIPWAYLSTIPVIGGYIKYLLVAPTWIFGLIIFCFSMAVLQSVRAWRLARMVTPKVVSTFLDNDYCVLLTSLADQSDGRKLGQSYYIRIKIDNKHNGTVKGVSARLENVSIKRGDKYEETTFRTPLKLRSGEETFSVQKRSSEYVNVFYINSTDKTVRLETCLKEYVKVFVEKGIYKLDIQISEENAVQRISLLFDWNGLYERPRVSLLSTCVL